MNLLDNLLKYYLFVTYYLILIVKFVIIVIFMN